MTDIEKVCSQFMLLIYENYGQTSLHFHEVRTPNIPRRLIPVLGQVIKPIVMRRDSIMFILLATSLYLKIFSSHNSTASWSIL
jgi:hypothetical protein